MKTTGHIAVEAKRDVGAQPRMPWTGLFAQGPNHLPDEYCVGVLAVNGTTSPFILRTVAAPRTNGDSITSGRTHADGAREKRLNNWLSVLPCGLPAAEAARPECAPASGGGRLRGPGRLLGPRESARRGSGTA
jgi:hypothetical protein